MVFDDIDKQLRGYESSHDRVVPEGVYMVVRIDGRGFSRLTNKLCHFEKPFDIKFRDLMIETVRHLMSFGFHIRYGYTQSDEISLLLDKDEQIYGRRERKILSILAGEASAKFSLGLGRVASFDCRISELPTPELVAKYFRWRQADSLRNSVNAYCYWLLRKDGNNFREVTETLKGIGPDEKKLILSSHGININDIPTWQKNGIGFWHETIERDGYNPITKQKVVTNRQRLVVEMDLPFGEKHEELVLNLLNEE